MTRKNRTKPDFCREVILHADDFGMNRSVTDGVLEGFRQGLLTSASLLSNSPDAPRALRLWKELLDDQSSARLPLHSRRSRLEDPFNMFDLGVHLNLTQGRPLTGNSFPVELLDEQGRFPGALTLFSRLRRHGVRLYRQIQNELARQVEFLLDHDLQPTHLNGHQYIEMAPLVADIVPQLLARYRIYVVRVAREDSLLRSTIMNSFSCRAWLLARIKQVFAKRFQERMEQLEVLHPHRFYGTAHAGQIDMRLIRLFLDQRRPSVEVEIGLHPALDFEADQTEADEDGWNDPLSASRPKELSLVTSQELGDYLENHGFRLGRLARLAAA